jgi:GDP-4-dehydro-6-deoxy-D-mannose reductase
MRVLVTGASGFVGRWLTETLGGAGHEVIAIGHDVDVLDADSISQALIDASPDAIAHLAAIAFAPDASADPAAAFSVAIGGTLNVLEAARSAERPPAVLVTGSSEVYGAPRSDDLPLRESAPLMPRSPYALSKAAQESVALAYAARFGMRVAVSRSFNHAGPGQRPVFVVPALAERIRALVAGDASDIPVGNIDVRRDLTDVRDVVDAYRLLLEAALEGTVPRGGIVVNVCSGRSIAIRFVVEELCRLAGVEPVIRVDRDLVRPNDPPEIRGDATLLENLTGWRATTPLTTTLADVWASVAGIPATAGLPSD